MVTATDDWSAELEMKTAICDVGEEDALACEPTLEEAPWEPYAFARSITFSDTQGDKAVRILVRDRSGNESEVVEARVAYVRLVGADEHGGIEVSLVGTAFDTTTDAAGAWRIDDVPADDYDLEITRDGYRPLHIYGFNVEPAEHRDLGELVLEPFTGRISGTLLRKAFVVRTRAGAVYRSVVPGWGQFYNGPDHYVKGYAITGGALLAIGAATAGFVLADRRNGEVARWDVGGEEYFARCRGDESVCKEEIARLRDEADRFSTIGVAAAATAGAIWLVGIVDAAINAEDHSEAVYGFHLTPGDGGWAGAVRVSWR